MSRTTELRIRISERGTLEIVDPGWDCLELLQSCNSGFRIQQAPLTGFIRPRFLQTRNSGCGYTTEEIKALPVPRLWEIHSCCLSGLDTAANIHPHPQGNEATVLDLKIELARRVMMHCTLCAQRCGVDRSRGETGICGLAMEARVAEHFVHIGEESPINPSLLISLAGCGLRCRFCQQSGILDPAAIAGESLDAALWQSLDASGARSLSFAGGNPDESLFAILRFLAAAPDDWNLPVVWNCHGAATTETVALLQGVVDAWLPDYKYGSETCGKRLSGIKNYPATAHSAILTMLKQHVPVIVRLLILPGHFACCHAPVLQSLAAMAREVPAGDLQVSVRAQYCPDWRIREQDGAMSRRPVSSEIEAVYTLLQELDLQFISAS